MLRRAAVLMLTEDINITLAGLMVGIEDQRYFRQQFVKLWADTFSIPEKIQVTVNTTEYHLQQ